MKTDKHVSVEKPSDRAIAAVVRFITGLTTAVQSLVLSVAVFHRVSDLGLSRFYSMKILLVLGIIAGLAILAALFFYLVGLAQPERHKASISFTLSKPRMTVWVALTDYAALPTWWPAIKAVRLESRPDGTAITWTTDRQGKEIGFQTVEERTPTRLVREIVGDELPFGGTWTYELAEQNGVTQLTVIEDGFIKPPFFRGIAKFFLKPDATMRDFEKHFIPYVATR